MNITELERWSEIPVQVSNAHLVERKLYGADAPSRMVSKADIWEADMVNRNKLIYNQSSTIGHGAPPPAVPFGINKDFEWGLPMIHNVKSRPAMSAQEAGGIPLIVQANTARDNKQRMLDDEYIMKNVRNNPYLPQRVPW
jgi:hypothetical protein